MEFKVLGPLEVTEQGRSLALGGRKRRALLAMLLLRRGKVVSIDELIDGIWGDEAPSGAEHGLQVYVSELRKLFAGLDGVEIVRRDPGYALELPADAPDLERLEHLRERGRVDLAAGRAAEAAATFRDALALWRGAPLADFAYEDFARQDIERLEDIRLETIEDRIDAELAAELPADVPELRALVEAHPFRERLRGALMLALYRDGRQAEALEEARRARSLLAEDLGVDPGPRLVELEAAILAQDPSLLPAASTPPIAVEPPRPPTRKIVTVLVATLVPERADGSALDPEAGAMTTDTAIATAVPILERHGATVRTDGHELVAVFGQPHAHEDDALRAVRAADEMARTLEEAASGDVRIATRSGIRTAEIVTGDTADGPVIDAARQARALAARLADPGTALDPVTHALVGNAVAVEPLDDRGAMALRSVDVRRDVLGVARRIDSPIVGREAELDELAGAFERVTTEHACRLVTVSGEAGIGKSRLVGEFLRRLPDVHVLVGRCVSYGDAITYWPIAEALRGIIGLRDDDVEEARRKLTDLLPPAPDTERVVDALLQILGLADVALSEGESSWSIRRFVEGLSAAQPLVLLVEDVHWAEPTLLDLIETIADWLRESPVLVVCTTRPEIFERRPGWGGGRPNASVMPLRPLAREDMDRLIENLVRHPGLDDAAKERIAEAAEGNPLFVEQLLSMLIDEGVLRQDRGAWSLTRDLRDVSLPTSVQTLLTARLDGLPAGERSLLGVGSVIGRSFDVGSAAVLSGADAGAIAASLHDLVRKDLVRPEHGAQDDLFRFRHVLIMQAAYEMVPKATRADLHRAVADRLETRSGDQAASDEMIGDHLARAAAYLMELGADGEGVQPLRTRAGQHLAAGGRRAYARSDMAAAASLFGRARDLLDPDDDTRVSFLADLAGAYIELGRFEDADRTFAEAIERGSAHGMSHVVADAVLFRFEAQLWSGNHDAAAVSAERARELIAEGEARDDLFAQQRGWSVLGIWADTWEEQTAFTQRAMALAEEVGDTKGVYENIQMLCGLLVEGPTPVDEGLKTTEEFRRRTAEDRVMQAAIIVNARAQLLAMSGHLEESREEYRWARQTFRDLGLSLWLSASGTIGPSVSELTAGDPAIAEAMLVEGIAGLKRIDARGTWLNVNLGLLASALVRQGRLDDARAAMAERATVVPDDDPWQRVLQGATSLLAGDVEAAVELLRMETPRGGEGWLGAAALVRSSLAAALRAAGREDEAREVAQGALDLYQRKGDVASARRLREFLDGT